MVSLARLITAVFLRLASGRPRRNFHQIPNFNNCTRGDCRVDNGCPTLQKHIKTLTFGATCSVTLGKSCPGSPLTIVRFMWVVLTHLRDKALNTFLRGGIVWAWWICTSNSRA